MKDLGKLGPDCGLLVIDIQERLMSAMPEMIRDHVVYQTETLALMADDYGAPLFLTEQYPKGLGPTVEPLIEACKGATKFEKTTFDACGDPEFKKAMDKLPDSVIVCGMETHICVLSTVHSLLKTGRRVVVPFDGVLSRFDPHHRNGLSQMEHAGADISNVETIVFATLGHSKAEHFKKYSKRIQ